MEEQNQNLEQEPQIQQEYKPVPQEGVVQKKNNWPLIIGVVVIFLVLVGGGIFWWLQANKTVVIEAEEVDQKNEIVLNEEKDKIDKLGWHEIEDTYWAFNMSFPEDLKIIKIGDHDGWKSEDDKSFFMTMGGSDIIVDFSDPESYELLVQQFELSEEFVEGKVIIINDMYVYNFIMDYPEDRVLYRGMKEHFMFIKNDHVVSILFLLDKNEDIERQRIKNHSIVDTFKFFEPAATGLDNQISKASQGIVILQGVLTEEKVLYPEYNYSHNMRINDNPIEHYLNTEYGQIVLYTNEKIFCPQYASAEGNLYGLKPKYDADKNYLGYYMDVISYECIENIDSDIDEDTVLINNDNVFFDADLDNIDTDGDGLNDVLEAMHGTDPNNPDTDGDGYLDGAEVENGYNPLGEGVLTTGELNDWGVSSEEQASRKSKISELLNLSTIYYDDNLTYLDFCVSSEVNIIESDLGVINFSCVSEFEAWAASVKLAEDKYWCVNSDYQPKETSFQVSDTFCP
ncbi:hypothetical protein HON36_00795 [Candidatus Parcubacteria bacterium]|jgi:hypothetical protein|nr:hypothetical protein [Candidatus Parcubacteria bacterium]